MDYIFYSREYILIYYKKFLLTYSTTQPQPLY